MEDAEFMNNHLLPNMLFILGYKCIIPERNGDMKGFCAILSAKMFMSGTCNIPGEVLAGAGGMPAGKGTIRAA